MDRKAKTPLNQGADAGCDWNREMIEKSQRGLVADRQIVAKSREIIRQTERLLSGEPDHSDGCKPAT